MKCFVYLLVNPLGGDDGLFYVGISQNPWHRFKTHARDRSSAAHLTLRSLLDEGIHQDQILMILKRYDTREEAIAVEYYLTTSLSGLTNKPYKKGRSY